MAKDWKPLAREAATACKAIGLISLARDIEIARSTEYAVPALRKANGSAADIMAAARRYTDKVASTEEGLCLLAADAATAMDLTCQAIEVCELHDTKALSHLAAVG